MFEQFLSFAKLQKGDETNHVVAGAFVDINAASTNANATAGNTYISSCFHTISDRYSWILDISATDHMSCDLAMFTSVPKPSNIKIKLPNNASATYISNIVFNDFLTLYNILYVP